MLYDLWYGLCYVIGSMPHVPCFTLYHQGGDVYEESEGEREDDHALGPIPAHAKQGAQLKDWDSLGPLQKRRQSQKAFDEMKKAAQVRNVEPERLAGNLLHRFRSQRIIKRVIMFYL